METEVFRGTILEASENRQLNIRQKLAQIPIKLDDLVLPDDMNTKAYDRIFAKRIKLHKERIMLWQKLGMLY